MRPADLLTIVHVTSDTILFRIRTYEHEAMWGKALTSYDLHSTLPEVTRHVGIVEVINKSRISDGVSSDDLLPIHARVMLPLQ